MNNLTQINIKILFSVLILTFLCTPILAQKPANKKFTIVIDAGHGGSDGGAQSIIKDENGAKVQEKNVTLSVALKLGKLIEEKNKDIKVIYTRNTDVFVELGTRAQIANDAKADLFVSIHCNSAKSSAYGTEVWILGSDSSRQDRNFDVVTRENSVIYLEDDYEKKYDGFDPNSPEDIIAMTLMQSKHYEGSLDIATLIDKEFKKSNRSSRGVKQSGFMVLVRTTMPATLVEIGFLSNPEEATLINSENGKNEIANNIYSAILNFKKEWDKKHKTTETVVEKPKEIEKPVEGVEYKIQFLTSTIQYKEGAIQLGGIKDVQVIKDGNYFRYFHGKTSLKSEKDRNLSFARKAGFVDAKAVEIKKNEKLSKGYYTIELLNTSKKHSTSDDIFSKIGKDVEREKADGIFYYTFGKANTIEEAEKLISMAKKAGFSDCIIVKKEK